MRSRFNSELGLTLAEVLVAVGLLTIATSIIGASMAQAMRSEQVIRDDGLAINELRNGLGWFAEDVKNAQAADIAGGVLSLTWTDRFDDVNENHTVIYEQVGPLLVRNHVDGALMDGHAVARRVSSVEFSISGRTVSIEMEVESQLGSTRTLSASAVMRPTP